MGKKRRSRVFPSDLAPELLLRLPTKSLSRFRCVCKSWDDLISDPDFGKQHRARLYPNPALLTCLSCYPAHDNDEDDDDLPDLLPNPAPLTFHISLFDSEGTLVRKITERSSSDYPLVISTCRDLILTRGFVFNIATEEVVITFPPSYAAVGLGHVASTDEFKVMALELPLGLRYKILTLGTDQWRIVYAPSYVKLRCAFANGAINIVGRDKSEINSLNLEREEWGVLAAPPLTHPNYALRELSGYLCMLDGVDANNSMDVWLLKDYDKGLWVKGYTICLSTLNAMDYWDAVNPLLIEDDGRLLVQVDEYSLQLYDPKTQSSREIQHFEKIEGADTLHVHVKCFSSLGHRANGSA